MTHDHLRRGGASKSRQLQALGSILLRQSGEQNAEAPEPDLSFSSENCLAHEGDDATDGDAFDAAWAQDS